MRDQNSEKLISLSASNRRVLVGTLVGLAAGALISAVILGAIAAKAKTPYESPIEVAGNSAHICTPFSPIADRPTVDNTTEAYLAQPDGSSRQPILLRVPWRSIRINGFEADQSVIDLVADQPGSRPTQVTITPHFPTVPHSDGHAIHNICAASQQGCIELGEIIFNDENGKQIMPPVSCQYSQPSTGQVVPKKCLLLLGSLKAVSTSYGCMNH